MRAWLLRTIAVAFVLTLGFTPVHAQTGQIFGEIVGRVGDDAGGVLPGVTVSLSGPAIMGVRSAVTNPDGQYRFPGINPGSYQVKFELSGFATLIRQEIIVAARSTVTIDIAMKIAGRAGNHHRHRRLADRGRGEPEGRGAVRRGAPRGGADRQTDLQHGDAGAGGGEFAAGSRRHQRDVEELHGRPRGQHLRDELFRRHGGHAAELRPDVLRRQAFTNTWRPSGSRRRTVENSRTIAGRPIGEPS